MKKCWFLILENGLQKDSLMFTKMLAKSPFTLLAELRIKIDFEKKKPTRQVSTENYPGTRCFPQLLQHVQLLRVERR